MPRDVLFIHGWWAADWVWARVAGRFEAAGFRTHALTLPGPGGGRDSFADNLDVALGAARSIGNPILVGHSAGGLMAMKMAESLSPPACIAITPAAPAGVLPRPNLLLLRFLAAAMPAILFGRDFFPRRLLGRIALNRLAPSDRRDVLDRMRPVSAAQVRVIVPSLIGVDRSRMDTPLLVVGASEDRLTPPAQTRAIARRYRAAYREYAGAGHFILCEATCDAMATGLIAWLGDTVPARPPGLTPTPAR